MPRRSRPAYAKTARAALAPALTAKDKLLEDAADDDGWAPPPLPLPHAEK